MSDQATKASVFTSLHIKGNPVILFNTWDPGSTKVVLEQDAKAIALGSHGVAEAFGYEDGEDIPLKLVFENAQRVVKMAGDLPVTLDFEAGYGNTFAEVKQSILGALDTGVIGFNIEDKKHNSGGLYSIEEMTERLQAVKEASQEYGIPAHLNARTDLFKETDPSEHNDELIERTLERAKAFKQAGADSFFAPLIIKSEHIKRICDESPLPVNIIWLPDMGMPSPEEIAKLGASRISYGPGPWLQMKAWLGEKAAAAL